MCGNAMLDIFDSEEVDEEEILRGKELAFVLFVALGLFLLLTISYEMIMPVINNPNYPFYNYVPDYTFTVPNASLKKLYH
uniref:Transmembrane protein n=1 Tax=Strongyloides venezuelensis TaxID=75913 RepID=A0A0K0FUS9_STRVS